MKKNYRLDYQGLLIELLKKCFVESFKVCDRFDGCGEYTLVIAVAIKDFLHIVPRFVIKAFASLHYYMSKFIFFRDLEGSNNVAYIA